MTETAPTHKSLLADGFWQVPPDERPANWETSYAGAKEPPDAPWSKAVAKVQPAVEAPKAEAAPARAVAKKKAGPKPAATVHKAADMENISLSATDASQVPHLQHELLAWSREKLAREEAEAKELRAALKHAQTHKWSTSALANALARATARVVYYRKILMALEAGYCLFPTIDCELFAVRTDRKNPTAKTAITHFGRRADQISVDALRLPPGDGRYVSSTPLVYEKTVVVDERMHDGQVQKVNRKEDWAEAFRDVEFPMVLSKPQIMEAASEAMALKIFDELGFLPARWNSEAMRSFHGDPIIVGRIIHPKNIAGWRNGRKVMERISFLIAWHVDTKDL